MRAVIDTNVLLSGLLWHGAPHALLEQVRNSILDLICSPALLDELARVASRAKFDQVLTHASTSRKQVLAEVQRLAEIIAPPPLSQPVCRDPDDDAVLALAFAAQADLIVSGDKDLLAIGVFRGIPILTPVQALERIANS